ncbi:daptide biosynthesis intramembrane metalloprotease [Arthrobacter sp. efr-133-TYG-104]|uniref:daptide biosynthesis intramembrane metalloprotease n=1 Tax=Arthrobacter sp. efr-133-TYG-104 TaxID=3040324 RepID=UPI00254C0094|nr:daptide biosynthesis intramembrane metalloprotease [Arthrobacter sp. efr-133-TYG-104]
MNGQYPWLSQIHLSDADEAGRVLVSSAAGPVLRLPDTLGRIVEEAQQSLPDIDVQVIADRLRATASAGRTGTVTKPVTGEEVQLLLDTLGKNPALARIDAPSTRRLQFRKPFSIQLTLLDPSRLLGRLPGIGRIIRSRGFWWSVAALNAVGVVAVAALLLDSQSALHDTTTVAGYLYLLLALYLAVFVHELSHAATLVAYGGTSRRVGFMLFYLVPAFFCDVTEAWKLKPAERAKVALAGIAAQGNLAAVAGVGAFVLPRDLATLAATFCALCFLYGVLNLLPFVKLDGYIALIGLLDTPNLRARCMHEFRAWTRTLIFRTGREPGLPSTPLRLLFGLLCAVFPLLILVGVVAAAGSYLSSLGKAAAWIQLFLAGALAIWLLMRGIGHVIELRKSGIRKGPATAYALALLAAAVVLVVAIPFPNNVRGGLYIDANGPKLVLLGGSTGSAGGTVDLFGPGLVSGSSIGKATAIGAPAPCTVPLAATVAVKESDLTREALCVRLDYAGTAPRTGTAVWEVPGQTMAQWAGNIVGRVMGP